MIVNIQDDILKLRQMNLLDNLLVDKTAKRNIMWATEEYARFGVGYEQNGIIMSELITGGRSDVIKTRARKEMERQSERTRQRGEVFTPLWICRKMNDHADEAWFGHADVFFQGEKPTPRVVFPKRKSWRHYVNSRRLELACGEAPYLVNRYDVETGEAIPIPNRAGLLDRKLRVVGENVQDEAEWLKWTCRAYWSSYGFDLQGDNVLIARVNLMMTFEEYMEARWDRRPTPEEYQKLVNIITWNIWQMDGLTGSIPCWAEEPPPVDWFGMLGECEESEKKPGDKQPRCRIFNWLGDRSEEFLALPTGGNHRMKFDFVIGNPPYQEETTQEVSETNGQSPKKNIFHYFQIAADKIADKATVLVYPAGRWIHRSGKGMDAFGLQQINDPRLKKVIVYANSREVFPEIEMADGIGIVIKDMKKTSPGFEYVHIEGGREVSMQMDCPGEALLPLNPADIAIVKKVDRFVEKLKLKYLHDRVLPRSLFGIESDFVQKNPNKVRPLAEVPQLNFRTQVKLLTNDKAGKAGRAKWFVVDRKMIKNGKKYIGEWQIVVSSANAGGQKRDNQLELIDNHSAFGRSRVALASFKGKREASNFYRYAQTYIARFMFLMTDESLTSLGKRVPDLMDYSNHNCLVNFSENLDKKLYQLIDFTDEEIRYIETTVDNLRKKGKKGGVN